MQPTMNQPPQDPRVVEGMLEHQRSLLALAVKERAAMMGLLEAQTAAAESNDQRDSTHQRMVFAASARLTIVMMEKHQLMVDNLQSQVNQLEEMLKHLRSNIVLPTMGPAGGGGRRM